MMYRNLDTYYCTTMNAEAGTFVKASTVLLVSTWGPRTGSTRMGVAAKQV